MSQERELVVLGTAAQAPTRYRNHNGYLLRWDDEAILFDPGEGTQRQLILADESASSITRICITHFHGDHCLGLPGVLLRRSLDRVERPVDVYYPASGDPYFERLRHATVSGDETFPVRPHPLTGPAEADAGPPFRLLALPLDHGPETLGWRLEEPDGHRMLPERLVALGVRGPDIAALRDAGRLRVGGRLVTLEEVSEPRRGQSFAFVMDTRLCDAAVELAAGVDLLVCESTFLDAEQSLADSFQHLTARQAAWLAREAGARRLVLTHFSQRHAGEEEYLAEASAVFPDVVAAHDLLRVPVPKQPRDPARQDGG
jgi:ribonuclease Z